MADKVYQELTKITRNLENVEFKNMNCSCCNLVNL